MPSISHQTLGANLPSGPQPLALLPHLRISLLLPEAKGGARLYHSSPLLGANEMLCSRGWMVLPEVQGVAFLWSQLEQWRGREEGDEWINSPSSCPLMGLLKILSLQSPNMPLIIQAPSGVSLKACRELWPMRWWTFWDCHHWSLPHTPFHQSSHPGTVPSK